MRALSEVGGDRVLLFLIPDRSGPRTLAVVEADVKREVGKNSEEEK